jgi:hypothetical protein
VRGSYAGPSSSSATAAPQQSSAMPAVSDTPAVNDTPSASEIPPASAPPTAQQQLASALVGMTDTVGATVTSATVGNMCSESPGPASSGTYNGCTDNTTFTQELITTWQKSGTVSFASGEIAFSDGTESNVSICVDASGNITWGNLDGSGMCALQFTPSPAYEATQPANIMAPWITTPAATFFLDNGTLRGGSILESDLGEIQNEDENLVNVPASDPGWAVLQNLGKKLTADANTALANPMPPIDPADYRAAASGYASAGVYMSHLEMADYNAASKAANGYFTSWINSWDS